MPVLPMLPLARKGDGETPADRQFATRFICLTGFLFLLLLLVQIVWL